MSLIEALMSLPDNGQATHVAGPTAAVLSSVAGRFARRNAALWSLTPDGCRFLAQFRPERTDIIRRVVIRLVHERDGPGFNLHCDDGRVLRAPRTGLRRSLRAIQAAHPGVKIVFDYRGP